MTQEDFAGRGRGRFGDEPDLVAGSLRAYRSWGIDVKMSRRLPYLVRNVTLTPVVYSQFPWQRTMVATCGGSSAPTSSGILGPHGDHQPPYAGCRCGIYAWYRPEDAMREHLGPVIGVVDMTGDTLLGERGVRGARATLVAVAPNPSYWDRSGFDLINPRGHEMRVDTRFLMDAIRTETTAGQRYEGVQVFDTYADLLAAYPPNLEPLRTLLGSRVVDRINEEAGDADRAVVARFRLGATSLALGRALAELGRRVNHLFMSLVRALKPVVLAAARAVAAASLRRPAAVPVEHPATERGAAAPVQRYDLLAGRSRPHLRQPRERPGAEGPGLGLPGAPRPVEGPEHPGPEGPDHQRRHDRDGDT